MRTNTSDNSPPHGRTEPSSQLQHLMVSHCTSTLNTENSFQDSTSEEEEEDFPTAPLVDDVWLEDPIQVRHLCIQDQSQPQYQCSYPCSYSLDLLHSAPEDTQAPYYEQMYICNISDFQDVITTTSDEDIPDLDDVFEL